MLYLHDAKVRHKTNPKSKFASESVVDIFAASESGDPVYVEVLRFRPWLYVEILSKDFSSFKNYLEQLYWYKNVHRCELVKKKRFVGFSDNSLFEYVLIEFSGQIPLCCGRKALRAMNSVRVFEDKVEPLLKFFHQTKVRPSSYFRIENYSETFGPGKSHCSAEYVVDVGCIFPVTDDIPPPPMTICAYDIETSGLDPKTDYIFQVAMCFQKLGEKLESDSGKQFKDGVVICVGETEEKNGTPIVRVENEVELLERFREIVLDRGVSIIVGYNSFQFDGQFMYKRAIDTYGLQCFRKIGILKEEVAELRVQTLESSALGRNELAQFVIPGRVEFDGLMILRRSHKLTSYKLNNVCQHFFGGEKDDISYSDILDACTTKDPSKLGDIATYCFQDAWLVLKLMDHLQEIYNGIEMSKLCVVPLRYIETRGQQIKCLSLILDQIYGEYVCNDFVKANISEGYQGATVLEASSGFHRTDPVVCLDFASLYPSIIRWKNLCYTTYLTSDEYVGIEGVIYEEFKTSAGKSETFAHRPGEKGILSKIEQSLGEARKATKVLMKSEKDPVKYSLLNSKQLAQKITMNSLYGFCGTRSGSLPLPAIAAAVTCTGRDMIDRTAEFVKKDMGGRVVYGDTDSVMCTFPVSDEIRAKGDLALLEHAYGRGMEAQEKASALFGDPVLLEYEKMYFPFLLLSKKRYATVSYIHPLSQPVITSSGLVTVRRDNAAIVRRSANQVIKFLMDREDDKPILNYLRSVLESLSSNNISVEDLTISKELKKHVEEYSTPVAHSVLAGKMKERAENQRVFRELVKPLFETVGGFEDEKLMDIYREMEIMRKKISFERREDVDMSSFVGQLQDGTLLTSSTTTTQSESHLEKFERLEGLSKSVEGRLISAGIKNNFDLGQHYRRFSSYDQVHWETPRLGNRIPYVVIRGAGKMCDRAEHPSLVKVCKHVKIDALYYIEQQLQNPLCGILKHAVSDMDVFDKLFSEFTRKARNANKGRLEITSFFSRNVKAKN